MTVDGSPVLWAHERVFSVRARRLSAVAGVVVLASAAGAGASALGSGSYGMLLAASAVALVTAPLYAVVPALHGTTWQLRSDGVFAYSGRWRVRELDLRAYPRVTCGEERGYVPGGRVANGLWRVDVRCWERPGRAIVMKLPAMGERELHELREAIRSVRTLD